MKFSVKSINLILDEPPLIVSKRTGTPPVILRFVPKTWQMPSCRVNELKLMEQLMRQKILIALERVTARMYECIYNLGVKGKEFLLG